MLLNDDDNDAGGGGGGGGGDDDDDDKQCRTWRPTGLVLMDEVGRSSWSLAAARLQRSSQRRDDAESTPGRPLDDVPVPLPARLRSASLSCSRLSSRTPCSSSRPVSSTPNPTLRSARRPDNSCSCGSANVRRLHGRF